MGRYEILLEAKSKAIVSETAARLRFQSPEELSSCSYEGGIFFPGWVFCPAGFPASRAIQGKVRVGRVRETATILLS